MGEEEWIRKVGQWIHAGEVERHGGTFQGIEALEDGEGKDLFSAMGLYDKQRPPDLAYNGNGYDYMVYAWKSEPLPPRSFILLYEEPGEAWRKSHPNRFQCFLYTLPHQEQAMHEERTMHEEQAMQEERAMYEERRERYFESVEKEERAVQKGLEREETEKNEERKGNEWQGG